MSWWARSLVNSLRGGDDDDDDEEEEFDEEEQEESTNENSHPIGSLSRAQEEGKVVVEEEEEEEEEEEGERPTRGVKDDLSELTKSLTRQLWGVASFLAPAPPGPDASGRPLDGQPDEASPLAEAAKSPRIAGIRNDIAEIGGKFKSGISSVLSHTMAVSEISKIASSLLPFESDEEEAGDDEVGIDAVGINEEILAFARNIAMHPETWLDFPLPHGKEDSDDFEMSDAQLEHALAIERLAPEFAALRTELCPSQISEGCFWKIYFVLLHSRLNRHDAELLSTPQIVEARAMLLHDLHSQTKLRSDTLGGEASYRKNDVTAISIEENIMEPSSVVNVTVPPTTLPYGVPGSDSMKDIETDSIEDVETEKHPIQIMASGCVEDVETEKHPVQATEVEIVDKSVIEEEPANQGKSKDISSQTSKDSSWRYEEDGDGWLEDDSGEVSSAGGAAIPLGQEEDVSFSDLEDDDDEDGNSRGPTTSSKTVSVDSQTKDSRGWVQLNSSGKGDTAIGLKMKESNDWLDIEDFDVE